MSSHPPTPPAQTQPLVSIRLLVALPAEARPIVRYFGLSRNDSQTPFPLYTRGDLLLAVTGIGSSCAEEAARWLLTRLPQGPTLWINIGIAGHPSRSVGEAVLAHQVEDRERKRSWRLDLPSHSVCDSDLLITCGVPERDYGEDALYDMEGAGFCAAVGTARPGSSRLCLKIVSDNRQHPLTQINGKIVSSLVRDRLPVLEGLMTQPAVPAESLTAPGLART